MANRDPRIDAYIAKAAPFAQPILERLRETVHEACPEVEETLKWSMPGFVHAGGILAGMAAFKQHVSFGYWKHALVMGEGVQRDGMGSYGRMASLKDLPPKKRLLADIRRAMKLNEEGVPAPGRAQVRRAQAAAGGPGGPGRRAEEEPARQGRLRRLSAQRAARLRGMDRPGQARGHPQQAAGAGGRMDGRGQAPELEVREVLSGRGLRPAAAP